MTPSRWHRTLRSSLRALSHFLWPLTPEQEEQEYQARLKQELHIRQQMLVNLSRRAERYRNRLEKLQNEESRLLKTRPLQWVGVQLRLRERLQRVLLRYQRALNRFKRLKRERAGSRGAWQRLDLKGATARPGV